MASTLVQLRRPDIALAGYEGWLPAQNLHTLHYFREGRSLCHLWRSNAPWQEMIPETGEAHPSHCGICRGVLDSEIHAAD